MHQPYLNSEKPKKKIFYEYLIDCLCPVRKYDHNFKPTSTGTQFENLNSKKHNVWNSSIPKNCKCILD